MNRVGRFFTQVVAQVTLQHSRHQAVGTSSTSCPTIARMLAERLELPLESILPTSELEPLGVDSLTAAELLFDLEDAFHLSLGVERPTLVTVQDIADHVDRLVQVAKPV